MTPIASGVIIKGKGEGIEAIMNDVVNREIEAQRQRDQQQHEKEIEVLRLAIEYRDKITEERHKMLGRRLAEYKVRPKRNILQDFCLYVVALPICVMEMIFRR